jgi:hypothetical protein
MTKNISWDETQIFDSNDDLKNLKKTEDNNKHTRSSAIESFQFISFTIGFNTKFVLIFPLLECLRKDAALAFVTKL